ncbi:MAG: hypothetical protein OXN89_06420 [Bryobacterales bacterium]|nr:hypothetical protein [Bryobacterales bacterium]
MSRRGREGAPSDDVLLRALDLLVKREGIVEAGERLGVNYRTAAKCLEERHVSRRMRQALEKYLREQTEQSDEREDQAFEGEPDVPATGLAGGGEEARLQEPGHDWRQEVEALRAEVASLRERVEVVEGQATQELGRRGEGDGDDVDGVDDHIDQPQGVVQAPRRVFPELITEAAEPGEEQVYGAAAETVVEWREAWAVRKRVRYTLGWLRAERRRLELELRLVGVFGLTPPPADAPWGERRREREVEWRRRALRRLRWQIPLTWCLHWLLRGLTLGRWGGATGA